MRKMMSRTGLVGVIGGLAACSGNDPGALPGLPADPNAADLEIVDGQWILEGDIVLGRVESDGDDTPRTPGRDSLAAGAFNQSQGFQGTGTFPGAPFGQPWTNATLTWRFGNITNATDTVDGNLAPGGNGVPDVMDSVRVAARTLDDTIGIRFVEETQAPFSANSVVVTDATAFCNSFVGMQGGAQTMNVGVCPNSLFFQMHEFGHALGLIHEQQRTDVGNNFTVGNTVNVPQDCAVENNAALLSDYDVTSIMQYPPNTLQCGVIAPVGGNPPANPSNTFTVYDVQGVQLMYGDQFNPTLAATSWGTNRVDVFVRATDGSVATKAYTGSNWSNWGTLEGFIIGAPAAAALTTNRIAVIAMDGNQGIQSRIWNGNNWSAWAPIGAQTFAGQPVVIRRSSTRARAFARGSDATLWEASYSTTNGWGNWSSLAGVIIGTPAAVAVDGSHTDVFVVGVDHALWHRSWTATSGWGAWTSLGGVVRGAPAVAERRTGTNDTVDILVKGTNGRVFHKTYNPQTQQYLPSQTGWDNVGNLSIIGNPIPVSARNNTLEVFARDQNGALRHTSRVGSGSFSAWANRGGWIAGSPVAVSWGLDRADVYVRGSDNSLVTIAMVDSSGTFSQYLGLDGTLSW